MDLGQGKISGVTYGTTNSAGRQLGDLRLDLSEKPTLTEFLNSLRGARVEIRLGAIPFAGRLISVERKTGIANARTLEVDQVSLLADNGEVKTVEVSPGAIVKLLDKNLSISLDRYLDIIASSRAADERQMKVATSGQGTRDVFVSYLSEVPVWKSTYRIVLGKDRKPMLQGWAIVDNTIGEDWRNVELSLVAGAPQSFVQKLSQPYFSRRPVVGLPESYNSAPQTYQGAIAVGPSLIGTVTDASGSIVAGATVKAIDWNGNVVGETVVGPAGRYELRGLPLGSVQLQVQSPGFQTAQVQNIDLSTGNRSQDVQLEVGAVNQTINVSASAAELNTSASSVRSGGRSGSGRMLGSGAQRSGTAFGAGPGSGSRGVPSAPPPNLADVSQARAGMQSAAAGGQLGDLFEYKLKEPITIRKNESALVPILQADVMVEKVSIWNDAQGLARPVRALWLTNSTKMTLDGGSFSVLDAEAFAGEGIIDPLQAGERRLLSYAADLALVPDSAAIETNDEIVRARAAKGFLIFDRQVTFKKTYRLRNNDKEARDVIVEHPRRMDRVLKNTNAEETTPNFHRFRLKVPPQQNASLVVEETQEYPQRYQISDLDSDKVNSLSVEGKLSPERKTLFSEVLKKKAALDALEEEQKAFEKERQGIYDEQERLRENVKALKGSAEEKALIQRYVGQLNEHENRLGQLKKEEQELAKKIEAAEGEMDKAVEAIVF